MEGAGGGSGLHLPLFLPPALTLVSPPPAPVPAESSTRMEQILKSARESGSLNLSNRSLSEVPKEVYNNLDTGSLDDKWWERVDLQKLILAHNNLEVIREDLRNMSSLVVLNISHNQLSSVPAAIGDLPLLKSLDVSFNQIKLIPEEVGLATALVKGAARSGRPRSQVTGSIFFGEDFLKNEAKLKKKKNLAQKSCRDLRMKGR